MAKPIFDRKNIMVVGGAGFIGSHLCDDLIREHKVICVDNFLTGSERNIDHLLKDPNFEFIKHDITQPLELAEQGMGLDKFKVAWQGVQEIYFLASPAAHGDIAQFPVETLQANAVGLDNVLKIAVQSKARVLYVSSGAVYGEPTKPGQRVTEAVVGQVDPLSDRYAYAEGKRFGEALMMAYYRKYGVEVRIARVFNTYGPRMRLTDTRMVVDFFRAASESLPITVYGGEQAVGSYCYVDDVVKALVKVMHQGDERPVNIGHDQEVRLADLARNIVALAGSTSTVNVVNEFAGDFRPQLLPDIRRAKDDLGWFPITLLSDGLAHTVDYLKASQDLIEVRSA